MLGAALFGVGLMACAASQKRIGEVVHLRLTIDSESGYRDYVRQFDFCVELRADDWIWIRHEPVIFEAVRKDGLVMRWSGEISMGEPENWGRYHFWFTIEKLQEWLREDGDYMVTARIGPVSSNPARIQREGRRFDPRG